MALLHARYHEPRKSHFRLPPYLKSIPCLESQTMKLPGLFLKKASHAHPFLTSTPYPALFLPASPCLQFPSIPQPQASPRQSCISPRPTALRENEVGGGGGGGLWPGARLSHHCERWLGRKAEVRKWPGPRRLPFHEKRSRSLRPDFRMVPSMLRAGKGEPRNTESLGNFPAGTVLVSLDS